MLSKKIILLCFVIIGGFSSCYYDNFAELNPGAGLSGCTDTAGTITFATKVLPIMQQNCGTSNPGCHQNNASTGFYDLNNKAGVDVAIADGKFLGSIKHEAGASAMPKTGGKLDDCSIAVIEKWINTGAN
jgi:hypothetical protein